MARGLLGALLAPALLAACSVTSQAPAASSGEIDECAEVLMLGARGSGEEPPYGDTVRTAIDQIEGALTSQHADLDIRHGWVDYPAVDPHTLSRIGTDHLLLDETMPDTDYFSSAGFGARQVTRVLDDSARRCPDERWVLVGFSQGAQVLTQALASRKDLDRAAGVLLIADPAQVPNTPGNSGSAADGTGLATALAHVRAEVAAARAADGSESDVTTAMIRAVVQLGTGEVPDERVRSAAEEAGYGLAHPAVTSICTAGDLVCDAGPGLLRVATSQSSFDREFETTRPIHGGYRDFHAAAASIATREGVLRVRRTGPDRLQLALLGAGVAVLLVGWATIGLVVRRRRRDTS